MRAVYDFSMQCMDDLPGIPAPLLDRIVVETARDLIRAGWLWRCELGPIVVPCGQGIYDIPGIPACATLHDFARVWVGCGGGIRSTSRSAKFLERGTGWTRLGSRIELHDAPPGELRIDAVLIPAPDADELPDCIYDEWIEAIKHGAKSKAMLSAKAPWSEPVLGKDHDIEWRIELGRARTYGRDGNASATVRRVKAWP